MMKFLKLFSIKIYYAAFGLARRFSVSSGEEMTTPASPVILRAGTDVLQKNLRGKIFWLTPARPQINQILIRKQRTENRGQRTAVYLLLCSMLYALCSVYCLFGAFDELNIGARPQGLGGAFTAIADDANALFYNPAGISNLKKAEFTSNYGRLFMGLDDNSSIGSSFIGYAQPTKKYGTPGISWYNLSLGSLYDETAIALSYSYPFSKYMSAGVSVKNLSRSFGSDDYTRTAINTTGDEIRIEGDPVFDKGKKSSALTGDVGLFYSYSKNISLGISAKNITKPDIGLMNIDKLSAVYRGGVSYKGDDYLFSFETVSKDSDINILTGAEKWFSQKNIAVRGGLSLGSRRWRTISVGSSLRFDNFSFDYAFLWPLSGIKDTLGTHKIALNIKFGKQKITKEEADLLKEREAKLKAQDEAKKSLLEAEKFQKEAERIKLESAEKLKEAQKAQEEAKKLQRISVGKDKDMEEIKKKDELEKSFKDSMLYYQKRVSMDAEFPERLLLLDKIIKKYENSGIDISDARKERTEVLKIQHSAETDYTSSISYYRRLKARGATTDEMRSLLIKIIAKYKSKGVNVSEAEQELETVK
ncbi:MAG: hypothetical protein WC947_05745 [Elusimicrobiota bacterium]